VGEILTAGALVEFGKRVIDLGDQLETAAQRAGVSGQAFSELAYAAKQNGVGVDQLQQALSKMNKAMSEAGTGAKLPTNALTALGLSFNDLKKLAPEQQLEVIADRISKLQSPADRSRAEIELFGRSGAELGPLFAQGAAGIEKLREEAQKVGASFSDETLKNLEEAHKAIDRMESSFSGLAATLVGKVSPALARFFDDITAIIYEPDAGVVRARRAAQAAAAAFEALGGKIVIGRATPSKFSNGKLEEISLDTGDTLRADTFVFALGPWLGKTFPEHFAKKTRVPMGYVIYFATPVGDHRFTYPNLPTYNFPGVTGWPALPVDNRGFRVRGAERAPTPAQTAAGAPNGPNTPVSTNGPVTDTGSNLANAGGASAPAGGRGNGNGRGGAGGGRGAGAGGGNGGGRGNQQQQDVPPQQQDPDTSDRWADQSRIDGSRRFVAHRFPLLKDAPVSQTHSCHYESTSSGNFIIDKHPEWSNVWISSGGNAEGAKFAPKIGDYVAHRVMGKTDPVDSQFKIPENEYPPPAPPPPTPADSTRAPRPTPPG